MIKISGAQAPTHQPGSMEPSQTGLIQKIINAVSEFFSWVKDTLFPNKDISLQDISSPFKNTQTWHRQWTPGILEQDQKRLPGLQKQLKAVDKDLKMNPEIPIGDNFREIPARQFVDALASNARRERLLKHREVLVAEISRLGGNNG